MSRISWAPAYENGTPPAGQVMEIAPGQLLNTEAALQWFALAAAFKAAFGIDLTTSEAGRSYARQVYLYNGYINGEPGFYPAAPPGNSTHGEFVAVDINSWVYGNRAGTERHNWLVANAPKYGWSWELVGRPSGEPWHFNYVFGLRSIIAGGNAATIITLTFIGEDDMKLAFDTEGRGYLFTSEGVWMFETEADYNLFYRLLTSDQNLTPFADAVRPHAPGAKEGKPHVFSREEVVKMESILRSMAAANVLQITGGPGKPILQQ